MTSLWWSGPRSRVARVVPAPVSWPARAPVTRAALASLTALLLAACGNQPPDPRSPLVGPGPSGFAHKADVGDVFTNGMVVVRNRGNGPVTLVAVRPELAGSGLTYLGARITDTRRGDGFLQLVDGYPPHDGSLGPLREADGAVLAEGSRAARWGYELLMGYRVTGRGRSAVRAVTVTYRDAQGEHTERWTQTMAVCVPREPAPCPQEFAAV